MDSGCLWQEGIISYEMCIFEIGQTLVPFPIGLHTSSINKNTVSFSCSFEVEYFCGVSMLFPLAAPRKKEDY